jgi:hypothetical protein
MADSKTTESKEQVPPYVAYKTLKNFLRSLSQGLPSRIDKSVMTSLSGGTQTQLLQALKYLGLITSTGVPTEQLHALVKAEGTAYQAALRNALVTSYPFLKNETIYLAAATMHELTEQFEALAGGDTVRKCVTFFIPAAKDAGIQLSPYIKEPGKRGPSNGKAKKQKAAKHDTAPEHHAPAAPQASPAMQMMLAKFPNFDPSWSPEVQAKWFESFDVLMAKMEGRKS